MGNGVFCGGWESSVHFGWIPQGRRAACFRSTAALLCRWLGGSLFLGTLVMPGETHEVWGVTLGVVCLEFNHGVRELGESGTSRCST